MLNVGDDITFTTHYGDGRIQEKWIRANAYNGSNKEAKCKLQLLEVAKNGNAIMGLNSNPVQVQASDGGDGNRFDFVEIGSWTHRQFDIVWVKQNEIEINVAAFEHWKNLYPESLGIGRYEMSISTIGDNCVSESKKLRIDFGGGFNITVLRD
jgi:hypothetical protein